MAITIKIDRIYTEEVVLDGSIFQHNKFKNLTLSELKQKVRLHRDGNELITRDGTTFSDSSAGEINFGYPYTGTAYLTFYENPQC